MDEGAVRETRHYNTRFAHRQGVRTITNTALRSALTHHSKTSCANLSVAALLRAFLVAALRRRDSRGPRRAPGHDRAAAPARGPRRDGGRDHRRRLRLLRDQRSYRRAGCRPRSIARPRGPKRLAGRAFTAIRRATCRRPQASARAGAAPRRRFRAASSTISLADECRDARIDERIVERYAASSCGRSSSSISRTPAATCTRQFSYAVPYAHVTANAGTETQVAQLRGRAARAGSSASGAAVSSAAAVVSRTKRCSSSPRRTARRSAWTSCSCPTR